MPSEVLTENCSILYGFENDIKEHINKDSNDYTYITDNLINKDQDDLKECDVATLEKILEVLQRLEKKIDNQDGDLDDID